MADGDGVLFVSRPHSPTMIGSMPLDHRFRSCEILQLESSVSSQESSSSGENA